MQNIRRGRVKIVVMISNVSLQANFVPPPPLPHGQFIVPP
jgi:hypothetical protein